MTTVKRRETDAMYEQINNLNITLLKRQTVDFVHFKDATTFILMLGLRPHSRYLLGLYKLKFYF